MSVDGDEMGDRWNVALSAAKRGGQRVVLQVPISGCIVRPPRSAPGFSLSFPDRTR